jgi:hypothetical protein
VEIRAKLESSDLEMLGQVRRPLDTSKTFDLFYQFESLVKMSEICSKYEQLGQLVGVQIFIAIVTTAARTGQLKPVVSLPVISTLCSTSVLVDGRPSPASFAFERVGHSWLINIIDVVPSMPSPTTTLPKPTP